MSEEPAGLLQELVDCIGDDAAVKMVLRFGGLRLRVPKSIPAGHRLEVLLGAEACHSLARVFGGEQIELPVAEAWRTRMVRARIAQMAEAGLGTRDIAQRLGMTQRGVQKAMAKSPRTGSGRAPVWRQLSLFPEDV